MKFSTAAFMDIYIGKLILNILSFLPPYPLQIERNIINRNLLFIKFWGFGSILESTPLCRTLRNYFPEAGIDILTFSENRQIAESLGLFGNVHTIDFHTSLFRIIVQTLQFVLKNRYKYGMIIDLEFFANYSAIVSKLLASPYSLGFDSFSRSRNRCYSRTIVFDHSNHIRSIFLKFLDALYINKERNIALSYPFVPAEKKRSVLEKLPGLKDASFKIAVNINASELSINRRWPSDNFRELIGLIQKDMLDVKVFLIGGKDDLQYVRSFYESLPHKRGVVVTAGMIDLIELSYMLAHMTCLVTNDSGPLHIAEAVDTPVVSFFGPETHNLYGPLLDKSLVFYKNLYCSPCLNTYNNKRSRCKDNQCLKLIKPEEVYERMKTTYFRERHGQRDSI